MRDKDAAAAATFAAVGLAGVEAVGRVEFRGLGIFGLRGGAGGPDVVFGGRVGEVFGGGGFERGAWGEGELGVGGGGGGGVGCGGGS